MTTLLIVGGADTGRAPMAAAFLRRLLEARGRSEVVESAGVLGHDGDPAEIEARDTMMHMGLDISAHRARSLTDAMVERAALVLAIDSGTALVVRARTPAAADRVHTLGKLAGRQRDIPDPFRMQIGAWLTYAREIEMLLEAALPRLLDLLPAVSTADPSPQIQPTDQIPAARTEAVERVERLLRLAVEMPGVLDWSAARAQIEAALAQATEPAGPGDLSVAYAGLLRAALALTAAQPSTGQLQALRDAIGRFARPIDQGDVNDLSSRLAGWPTM